MRPFRAVVGSLSVFLFLLLASDSLFAAPSITGISPTSGPSGTSVTITGNGFGNTKGTGSTVTFGGVVASTTAWGNKSITAVVPSGLSNGAATVVVTVGGVASNNNFAFTVANPITIQALNPLSGPSGT